MPKFERHVFVCCDAREPGHPRGCCASQDGELILQAFKTALMQNGLQARVRVNQAGCLDQCEHGPSVVVYPEQTWYGFVSVEDVAEIVEKHLVGGAPVQRRVLPDGCINTAECPHRTDGTMGLGLAR